uniref:DUF19 domain-containing protein n=1 Tax=Trichobilharzia regenti TaxID=157069 RepID=A0AA85J1Q6_TRIRE|nr:unnamed protein product [Trichobilharzia regenti]
MVRPSLSVVAVIIVLLHCTSLVTVEGFGSRKQVDVCADAEKTKLTKRKADNFNRIIDSYKNNLKDVFPSKSNITDQYVNCINKNYLEYYKPHICNDDLVPDIKESLLRCKYSSEGNKKYDYTGCDKFQPSISSQELLPLYEKIADRLTSAHQWYRTKRQC